MSLDDLRKGKESTDTLRADLIILAVFVVVLVGCAIYAHYVR